jgi:hypothetical protein
MADLPTVMTAAGLQPIAPVDLRQMLVDLVAATNPGYTADLPGTLIEDIASTDVAALVQCDQIRIELLNALTPNGANEFLLTQMGAMFGVPRGQASNVTVLVQFTGTPGFVVAAGFLVSDGTYQYSVTDGGVVGNSGTGNLTAVATQTGTWAVPANTVNQLVTSVPADVELLVNNPLPGTPASDVPPLTDYRSQVLRAGLVAAQGMPRFLKTLLRNVVGVDERLVSVLQRGSKWLVLVGGNGDTYQIAAAIFNSVLDSTSLTGSEIQVTGITRANPGVVTTDLTHLLIDGQVIGISGIKGMTPLNSLPLTVTVISSTSFSVGVDTTGYAAWIEGGVITPNARNVVVAIDDYPDSYLIPFVVPPLQNVRITATWNTSATNFVGASAIASVTSPALIEYVNSIPAGQPIILYELENAFRDALANILTPQQLTRMTFDVTIDGVGVTPTPGTGIIAGDRESYLFAAAGSVTVVQG